MVVKIAKTQKHRESFKRTQRENETYFIKKTDNYFSANAVENIWYLQNF